MFVQPAACVGVRMNPVFTMRVPGALLLAAALALVADAANPGEGDASRQLGGSGPRGKTTYLFETMATGDSIVVAEHGPITLTAVCRSEVRRAYFASAMRARARPRLVHRVVSYI